MPRPVITRSEKCQVVVTRGRRRDDSGKRKRILQVALLKSDGLKTERSALSSRVAELFWPWRVFDWKTRSSRAYRSSFWCCPCCSSTNRPRTRCATWPFSNGFWSTRPKCVRCSTPTVWVGTPAPTGAKYTFPFWASCSTWRRADGFTGPAVRTTLLPVSETKKYIFNHFFFPLCAVNSLHYITRQYWIHYKLKKNTHFRQIYTVFRSQVATPVVRSSPVCLKRRTWPTTFPTWNPTIS